MCGHWHDLAFDHRVKVNQQSILYNFWTTLQASEHDTPQLEEHKNVARFKTQTTTGLFQREMFIHVAYALRSWGASIVGDSIGGARDAVIQVLLNSVVWLESCAMSDPF